MLKNYFKTAWRNLWKNKIYSLINIAGLAIGMAAFILIMLFVSYEKSFDNFQPDQVYRLNEVQKFPGMVASQKVALSMFPMGPTLQQEFPEIKNFTRIHWADKYEISRKDQRIYLPHTYFVDSNFFEMFRFKLLEGDPATALLKPNSAVLTRKTAQILFGKEDPIGKTVTHYSTDTTSFVVRGVVADVPENSQLQFDALFSFNTIYQPWMNGWGGNWLDTYLELSPHIDLAALEKKFPAYLKKHMTNGDYWKYYELFLVPLKAVHGGTSDIGLDYLNYQKFDRHYTDIFLGIALIVLLIACINFMNLSTARSAERAREVGVRKSIGANRWQLSVQFIGESVILSLGALLLSLILVALFLPFVNELSRRHLAFPLFSNGRLLVTVLAGAVAVGILSGLYPAAYLSSFQPVKVLKASFRGSGRNSVLRNALVVLQFSSAIFLIIATTFAVRQLYYMEHRDPGFNRNQVITISLDQVTNGKFDLLKQELMRSPYVAGVTAAQDQLGSHLDQSGVQFIGDGPRRDLTATRLIVDPDYLRLYQIPLLLGNNFSSAPAENGREYIINEALAKELLKSESGATMSSLLGKNFGFDSSGTIIGIAKNFNFNSLHYKIETLFLYNQQKWGFSNLSVKIKGDQAKQAIAAIQSTWSRLFPGHPLDYQFLDEHFAEVYRADAQVSWIVGVLAALAIVISCLGLFGLASYSAEKRIKEVGIRKTLGASVHHIVGMLSRDFLRYVLVATLIAWPLAWWWVHHWLQDYAYRTGINWWIFLAAGLLAMVIAFLTTGFQAMKAATANPVKSLRAE